MNQNRTEDKKSGGGPLRQAYRRFLKIRGNPHEIAAGLAVGVFVASSPFFGVHMALAVFLAAVFKWNKMAALAGVWFNNPVTMPALYSATWFAGARITGIKLAEHIPHSLSLKTTYAFLLKTPVILYTLTLGGVIVGVPLAIIVYYVALGLLKKYQEGVREKLRKRKVRRKKKKKSRKKKKKKKNRR
ncbi:MAG: hypothetical protein DSY89_00545 [Deltaproteobacteria bacterium]|nr:MAG: hypothetical protein DSY89_00545 [Deltaproteobacteria bacterium]